MSCQTALRWIAPLLVLVSAAMFASCGSEEEQARETLGLLPGETLEENAVSWLEDPDPQRRSLALLALVRRPERVVAEWPKLRTLLDDEDEKVRQAALMLLPLAHPDRSMMRDLLLTRLCTDDPRRADEAAIGLRLGAFDLADALPDLMGELRRDPMDEYRNPLRCAIAYLVGSVGPAASNHVTALLELMENDAAVASSVARALSHIVREDDPQRDAVLAALRRAWDSEDQAIRSAANVAYDAIRYGDEDE